MKYQITISGEKYWISEEEAQNIAKGEMKGLVFVPTIKGYINLSFVQSVIPENKIDRSQMNKGRLHDGTLVIKKFGNWVDAENPSVELDYKYYPELAIDNVMSEEEYDLYYDIHNKLLTEKTEKILNCTKCKGTGYESYYGEFTYSPTRRMCSCFAEEIERKKNKNYLVKESRRKTNP